MINISLLLTSLVLSLLGLLASPSLASPTPDPHPHPRPAPGSITDLPVVGPVLDLLNDPPPPLLRTTKPSRECKKINQGELMCCRGAVAGDLQPIVWLASVYGYYLNPNDVNGLDCACPLSIPFLLLAFTVSLFRSVGLTLMISGDNNLDACPGVKMCCETTTLVSSVGPLYLMDGLLSRHQLIS